MKTENISIDSAVSLLKVGGDDIELNRSQYLCSGDSRILIPAIHMRDLVGYSFKIDDGKGSSFSISISNIVKRYRETSMGNLSNSGASSNNGDVECPDGGCH